MSLSLLDKSIPDIEKALPRLSFGELEALLDAERNGKTRKGAIAAIEAALEAADPPAEGDEPDEADMGAPDEGDGLVEITNERDGILVLRDGRRLARGESARVDPAVRDIARQEGWIE